MATNQVVRTTFQFNADTRAAKQAMRDLQSTIDRAIETSSQATPIGITKSLASAQQSAYQLKNALQSAMNVDTGKLNLNKFMIHMKQSGLSIKKLGSDLSKLGPEGQKAFSQMAQAVAAADTKIFSLSDGVKKLMDTFANTMRYQAATAAIQGVTGAIGDAIRYTKELDKSLTDIRIVTGKSTKEMAKFATYANKAAKNLSTTTKEYANASLIYFQQGLTAAEVNKRTETTIKLANAVGTSAEQASEWMTAIWNNFDNGNKSLEYYGDVLAELGAKTAASADEIASGLEKFSAVADTVGLSYEYAASTVATIAAETRQSADVVGTSLKTIFSRMEGLKLGETLDDGTTLNQYSAALSAVGVNIKTTTGELKDMDQILDETASRWKTLSEDQQIALAQSVAGVRQYNQFIALMSNYDTMQENVDSARKSAGSLQDMQDTYADSVEGQQKRMQSSAEKLYSTLFDPEMLKGFYSGISKVMDFVSSLIDSFGGLKGILLLVSSIFAKIYQPKIAAFMRNTAYAIQDFAFSVKNLFDQGRFESDRAINYKKQAIEEAKKLEQAQSGGFASGKVAGKVAEARMALAGAGDKLNPQVRETLEIELQIAEAIKEQVRQEEKRTEELVEQAATLHDQAQEQWQSSQEGRRQQSENEWAAYSREKAAYDQEMAAREKVKELGVQGYVTQAKTVNQNNQGAIDAAKSAMNQGNLTVDHLQGALSELKKFEAALIENGILPFDSLSQAIEKLESNIAKYENDPSGNVGTEDAKEIRGAVGSISVQSVAVPRGRAPEAPTEPPAILREERQLSTEYLEQRSRRVGALRASTTAISTLADRGEDASSDDMQWHLKRTQERVTDLGIKEVDDEGNVTDQELDVQKYIEEQTNGGESFKRAIQKLVAMIAQQADAAIEEAAQNTVAGSVNKDQAALNAMDAVASSDNMGDQIRTLDAATTQLEGSENLTEDQIKSVKALQKEMEPVIAQYERMRKLHAKKKSGKTLTEEELKAYKEFEKQLPKTQQKVQGFAKQARKLAQDIGRGNEGVQAATEEQEDYGDILEDNIEHLRNYANASADAGQSQAIVDDKVDQTSDTMDLIAEACTKGKQKFTDWADVVSTGFSTAVSLTSGLINLGSAFENLGEKVTSGEASLSDYISTALTAAQSIEQLVGPIFKVIGAIASKIIMKKMEKKASKETTEQEIKDNAKESESSMANGVVNVAENVAKGYAFWPAAIVGAAALLAVGAAVAIPALKKGKEKGEEEAEKKALETNIELNNKQLEAIDITKELSTSVKDLTEEYNNLRASGEDAMSVFENMVKTIPNLIDNYTKLAETLGISIDTEGLRQAYNTLLLTGDTTQWDEAQQQEDAKIQMAERQKASGNLTSQTSLMVRAAEKGTGYVENGQFKFDFNSDSYNLNADESEQLRNTVMGKYDEDGNDVYGVDMDDPQAVLQFYNDMQTALTELANAGITSGTHVTVLQDDIKEMAEQAEAAQETLDRLFTLAKEGFIDSNQASLIASGKDIYGNNTNQWGAITSFEDYKAYRDEILAYMQEVYKISEEQAQQMLLDSDEFANYEIGFDKFAKDGAIDVALQMNGFSGGTDNEDFLTWFNSLSKEEQTLAFNIDYTSVNNLQDLNEQLDLLREKMRSHEIMQEASKLGISEEAFESYTDILADNNEHLEENALITKEVALAQAKMNKGLSDLAKDWDKIRKTLKENNRNTLDYAEAIGSIKVALEKAFGYKPSTSFIEEHLEDIGDLIEGDISKLSTLQKLMAQDAIENLEINPTFALDVEGVASADIQNSLYALLDDLDTSLEIGKGTALSQDYMNTLQTALDSGQITMEQLNSIMSTAGFALEITDWKSVPGPVKVITTGKELDDNGNVVGEKTYTQEYISVPVINGQDELIGSGTTVKVDPPKAVRTVNSTSISQSSLASPEEDKSKSVDEEVERYHEIERTIASLERQYSRLSQAKEQAFGKRKIALIKQEQQALEEIGDAIQQQLSEANEYLESDRAALEKYGVSFGANGEITNYDEVYAAQIAQYNTDPEAYEESYAEFQRLMSQYEETLDTVESLTDDALANALEQINSKMEEISYTVEVNVSLSEDSMATIDFFMSGLTDSAQDAAEKIALMGRQIEATITNAETYKKGIGDILGISGIDLDQVLSDPAYLESIIASKNLTEEQINSLREYRNGLIKSTQSMREYRESISDTIIAAFNEANAELDKFSSNLEHTASMIEGYRNILDLAGRDALGISDKLMAAAASSQYQIANSQISVAKSRLEQNTALMKELEENIAKGGSEEELKEWEEAYEEVSAKVKENQQALLDVTSTALEAAVALFEEEMNGIMRAFEDSMSGAYGNFQQFSDALSRQQEISSRYLKDYQEIYELSKLNRDILKSIDAQDSIAAKAKLRDIQEEINALQEDNVQMTQYEVNELRAKYELRLAEIALEDAQNAKSQVRMQRDSAGNWGYVYTANQQDIAKAQQAYEDKLYAYQNTTQQRTEEMVNLMASIPQQYSDAVRSIYEDQTLNDEERALAIAEVQSYYEDMYRYAVDQFGIASQDARALYETDWKEYSNITGYKISANEEWLDNFNETVYAQKLGYTTLDEAQISFAQASDEMLIKLHQSYEKYRVNIKTTLDSSLGDIEEFLGSDDSEGSFAYYLREAEKCAEDEAAAAQQMAKDSAQAFEDLVDEAESWLDQYDGVIDDWCTVTGEIASAVQDVISSYYSLEDELYDTANAYRAVEQAAKAALQAEGRQISSNSNTTQTPKVTGDQTVTGYSNSWTVRDANGKGTQKTVDGSTTKIQVIDEGIDGQGATAMVYDSTTGQTFWMKKSDYVKVWGNEAWNAAEAQLTQDERDSQDQRFNSNDWRPENYIGHKPNLDVSQKNVGCYSSMWDLENKYIDGMNWVQSTSGFVVAGQSVVDQWNDQINQKSYVTFNNQDWFRASDLFSYDTGGYTGEWDSSGRMAMLHQKELVLNAHDTENFLAGIDILRDITRAIDLQTAHQRLALQNYNAALNWHQIAQDGLEQNIVIHAEFPAARERTEIEAAFDSLLNRASQFANRKK